jgi:arylsulfatase
MVLAQETVDVLICGYLSHDAAREDYESVLRSDAYIHGATVVSKDLEGKLSVEQTDHMVREAAQGLAGVGLAVGLFMWPLLPATTALGAAFGAGVGEFLHQTSAHKLKEEAGATIPIGGAGLILVYPAASAEAVESAVKRAISRTIGEAAGRHLQAVRGALTDARHNMAAGPAL